ncbi:MAG: mycothiol synthase, partial [Nocardioides sp.]
MVAAATADDGVAALDEATLLTLSHHPERATWWGDERGVALVIGDELSLVVRPEARRTGVAGGLLATAPPALAAARTAWSHGDHPGATAL